MDTGLQEVQGCSNHIDRKSLVHAHPDRRLNMSLTPKRDEYLHTGTACFCKNWKLTVSASGTQDTHNTQAFLTIIPIRTTVHCGALIGSILERLATTVGLVSFAVRT